MHRLLVLLALLIIIANNAFAVRVGIYADPAGTDYHIDDALGLVKLYVVVHPLAASEVAALQFAAPLPACITNAIWLSDETMFPVTIGNSQAGVAIGFGACEPAPVHVLTINVFMQGLTTNCCYYHVIADPSVPSGQIEFVDCNSTLGFGVGSYALVANRAHSNPSPAHLSTSQPVNSTLSWDVNLCDDGHEPNHQVFFGTDPVSPPLVASTASQSYDPGPLTPNTVYYWKVETTGFYTSIESPIWRFQTEGAVPAEPATWGAIKELFRN